MYQFQAKALGGRLIRGEIDASTDTEARVKLRAQQLIPIKVILKGQRTLTGAAFTDTRVKPKDLQIFTRQFSTLINSGIPVVQSLQILGSSTSSVVLRNALKKVSSELESGKRLGDCLEPHGNVFDTLYVNLVKAGEEGGVLDTILNRLAAYIEKSVKIRNKVQGALFYPAAILCVAAIVIFAIMTFVIPKFKELFSSSGQELPALTQLVVGMSEVFVSYWYLIVGTVVGGAIFIKQWVGTAEGKQTIDTYMIGFPIFGPLLQKAAIARFTRTLSTMLASGVSIIDALDISAKVCGNYLIERSLMGAKKSISEGKSIVTPLATNKYIPDMVVQMIGVGEQTGALDIMCGKIADFYEEEVDYAVTALTSVIEPIMMVFLGGIIAFLVIAMYLPIFNMAATMGG